MVRFESDEEVRRLASALARLRQSAGLSQAEAGQRAGMTSQGWSAYESGRRPGLFRPDVQRRLTTALGVDAETLALEAAGDATPSPPGLSRGVESSARTWRGTGSSAELTRVTLEDDILSPWADRGVTLEWRPAEPRPGQGVIAQLKSGERIIGLTADADPRRVVVTVNIALNETREIAREDIATLGAVIARLDP